MVVSTTDRIFRAGIGIGGPIPPDASIPAAPRGAHEIGDRRHMESL